MVCLGPKGFNEAKIEISEEEKPDKAFAFVHTHPSHKGYSAEPSKGLTFDAKDAKPLRLMASALII